MAPKTAAEAYQQIVSSLPDAEQLRLVEQIVHRLALMRPRGDEEEERYDWMELAGIAPNLLDGEDAQEWVTRTRRGSDEHREKCLKGKP